MSQAVSEFELLVGRVLKRVILDCQGLQISRVVGRRTILRARDTSSVTLVEDLTGGQDHGASDSRRASYSLVTKSH